MSSLFLQAINIISEINVHNDGYTSHLNRIRIKKKTVIKQEDFTNYCLFESDDSVDQSVKLNLNSSDDLSTQDIATHIEHRCKFKHSSRSFYHSRIKPTCIIKSSVIKNSSIIHVHFNQEH